MQLRKRGAKAGMEKLKSEQDSTTARTAAQGRWGDKPATVDEMSGHLRPIIRQLRRQLEELNGSILALERIVCIRSGPGRSPKATNPPKRRVRG